MNNTVKVGVFMAVALAVLGYLILHVEQISLFKPKGHEYKAQFANVAGLDDQAAVRVAGVRIGRVDGIKLRGEQALVRLVVERDVPVTQGSYAEIKNMGLLGDKYVELVPGPYNAPVLREGATIPGQPAFSIDQMMSSVGGLGSSLQEVGKQLAGQAPATGPLGRLVVNLETTSAELRDLIAANRGNVDATMSNFRAMSASLAQELPEISAQLQGLLAEVHAVVAENRGSVHEGLENVDKLTANLQTSVDNLNTITGRLARGEGTMGKLLTSDEAHKELVGALQSVQSGVTNLSSTLNRVQKLQLELSMQGFYLSKGQQQDQHGHGDFRVDIDPQSGHLYRLAISQDPGGRVDTKTQTITTTAADGTVSQQTIETRTAEDRTTTSALLGVPINDRYRLWAGLIESRFGVEADFMPTTRWGVTFQAFDFNRTNDENAHLRLLGSWHATPHIYLLGGVDDPLSKSRDSLFLGAGIRWRDDDLKYLLGSVPIGR